jgi:RimJ/RimL family protein N-acetyltransferase
VTGATVRTYVPEYVGDVAPHLLTDGRLVDIRPIRSDDGERLQAAHSRLSAESRYRRFLGPKPTLTAADARYLVDVDGSDHFALVATAPAGAEDGSIVAVTRFIRVTDEPEVAEFAIVVGDDYQRAGLATEMLDRLARAALERGVCRFRAIMLADNVAVRRMLERLGAGELHEERRGPLSEIEIRLSLVPGPVPGWAPAMIAGCAGS